LFARILTKKSDGPQLDQSRDVEGDDEKDWTEIIEPEDLEKVKWGIPEEEEEDD